MSAFEKFHRGRGGLVDDLTAFNLMGITFGLITLSIGLAAVIYLSSRRPKRHGKSKIAVTRRHQDHF